MLLSPLATSSFSAETASDDGLGVVIGMPVTYLIVIGGLTGGLTSVSDDAILSQQCSYEREKERGGRFR